ncbi:ABC transporter substrate-binding protein [Nannocystis pusilla]|uniref:ABC transporter substrate-binding protein n=1 Tax=Nannocystis pusilla TaxID=889268 RepID=UPI003DA5A282
MRPPRIACLVPAATDLAADLGLDIVGVSHECDHPIARGLPVLTRSRIAAMHPRGPGPAEIDLQVSAAVAAGEPLYTVDRAALARLAPDIVLSQAICNVCAARADSCDLPPGASLVELAATSLSGLADDVRAVAAAAGVPERGEACLADIAANLAALVRPLDRPRTLALEWGDPPFLGGHWVPELVALAGGAHLLSGTGQPSRRASWAEIAAADPDLVVFMPCGYDLAAAAAEAEALCRSSPLGRIRCVRAGQLWAVDAVRLFSRCTPRSVTHGAAVLAALLRGDEPPIAQACRIESTPALS